MKWILWETSCKKFVINHISFKAWRTWLLIIFCLLITTNCNFFITFQTVSCACTHLLWNYFTPKSVTDYFLAKKIFLEPYILFFKSIREGERLSQIPLRIWECDSVILCKEALTILVTVLCFFCIPE